MASHQWGRCGVDIFLLVSSISTVCHDLPDFMLTQDIYACIHPNPRIAVNITHSGWNGYKVMMFMFGFAWGCVNLAVFWGYFCTGFAFGSGRQTIFTIFIVAPIAVVLILGPFFSPWVALPLAQKVRNCLSVIIPL